MTKLSNAKKSIKSVQTVEINTVDVAADTVANTLVNRIALDASDLRANNHAFAGAEIDYSLESSVIDLVNFAAPAVSENGGTYIDPMSEHYGKRVKLSYVFDGMTLDIGLFQAEDASKEAETRANDKGGPKVPVAIMDATSGQTLFTVYPVKGVRNVSVVSGARQTSTRTVASAGMTEEQRKAQEAEKQRKEEERAAKAWDAMVDAAEKDNAKFDAQREKQVREMAKKLAKAMEKMRRHPKEDTEAYQNYLLLTEESGATCKELNNAHNIRNGTTTANFGWKQIALDMEKKFSLRLIATGRQCQVSDKKGLSEAMRLIDRDLDIPAGWVDISRF